MRAMANVLRSRSFLNRLYIARRVTDAGSGSFFAKRDTRMLICAKRVSRALWHPIAVC